MVFFFFTASLFYFQERVKHKKFKLTTQHSIELSNKKNGCCFLLAFGLFFKLMEIYGSLKSHNHTDCHWFIVTGFFFKKYCV